jgi:hypothetical protein
MRVSNQTAFIGTSDHGYIAIGRSVSANDFLTFLGPVNSECAEV